MGFSGLRFDIPWRAPAEYIRAAFDAMASSRLESLAIIGGWMRWENDEPKAAKGFAPPLHLIGIEARRIAEILLRSHRIASVSFEVGNEPDISDWKSPQEFSSFVRAGAQGVWEVIPSAAVLVGGVSNVNRKGGARYLESILDSGEMDKRMVVAVHPYRWDRRPHEAPEGWESLNDVFKWLRAIGRPFWASEGGWHTSPQTIRSGPFGLCKRGLRWTDADVAEFAGLEMDLWRNAGADAYGWYQINSGPDPSEREHNFGLRFADMTPRPAARTFEMMGAA
jgi:hypothetical protein